jgi:hypothetical protein
MKDRGRNRATLTRLMKCTLGAALAASAIAWLGMWGGVTGAAAQAPARANGTHVQTVADDSPGYAVEDFNYPGADKILSDTGIVLKRGDGHITLTDCANGTGLLHFYSRVNDEVCFQATGNSGWLTLEIPSVYGVRGNDYTTDVDMTTGDDEQSYEVPENSWTPVGESADDQGRQFTLVEIRTSK